MFVIVFDGFRMVSHRSYMFFIVVLWLSIFLAFMCFNGFHLLCGSICLMLFLDGLHGSITWMDNAAPKHQ